MRKENCWWVWRYIAHWHRLELRWIIKSKEKHLKHSESPSFVGSKKAASFAWAIAWNEHDCFHQPTIKNIMNTYILKNTRSENIKCTVQAYTKILGRGWYHWLTITWWVFGNMEAAGTGKPLFWFDGFIEAEYWPYAWWESMMFPNCIYWCHERALNEKREREAQSLLQCLDGLSFVVPANR